MRINPNKKFAGGVPILKARNLLRSWWALDARVIQSELAMSQEQALVLLRDLEARGYIARGDDQKYEQTEAGTAFARAKATRALRRKTAEKILGRFLKRVDEVRTNPAYLWRAERIILFGSMTSGMERVNGIDLAIQYERKEPDDEVYKALAAKCADEAQEAGRQLLTYDAYYGWPMQKVYLHLKMNSWGLNLYRLLDWEPPPQLPGSRQIYVHHDDSPGQRKLFETNE